MTAEKKELLWRQYAMHVDLYKTYLDLVVKFNVFFYAITGGILSYYFANRAAVPALRLVLLLPLVISFGFSALAGYASVALRSVDHELRSIAASLEFHTSPNAKILAVLLRLSALAMFLCGLALLIMLLQR